MTKSQKVYLLSTLHSTPNSKRNEFLHNEMKNFALTDSEIQTEYHNIISEFNSSIGTLNSKQFENLVNEEKIKHDINNVRRRLGIYEIKKDYQDNIISFFQSFAQANEPIDVGELDLEFKGIQVASRDNFNTIINQGWTGDWDLNPENINIRNVQIASMNDDGQFPRGYYLNAEIVKIEPINYPEKVRYRIFFSNPKIINTGNRNVKFIAQPVRYIR